VNFGSTGSVVLTMPNTLRFTSLAFSFVMRTSGGSGSIVRVGASSGSDYIAVVLSSGRIGAMFSLGSGTAFGLSDFALTPDKWTNISVVFESNTVSISTDDTLALELSGIAGSISLESPGLVFVGATNVTGSTSFVGSLRGLKVLDFSVTELLGAGSPLVTAQGFVFR
jgi:hypothetical protein